MKKVGGVQEWSLAHIVHTQIRIGEPLSQAKLDLAEHRLLTYGWRGELPVRLLPDDITAELGGGNHRFVILQKLGFLTVPVQFYEGTNEEFYDLYTIDNHHVDDQSTIWALNLVKHARSIYWAKYQAEGERAESKMYAVLANQMGLREAEVTALREMNAALTNNVLVPEIATLPNIHLAVVLWNRIKKAGASTVPHDLQREVITYIANPDIIDKEGHIRHRILLAADVSAQPRRRGRVILSLEDRLVNLGITLDMLTREAEDDVEVDSVELEKLQEKWDRLMSCFSEVSEENFNGASS